METVKIIGGKRGWHLKVNGLYINHGFNSDYEPVKAIKSELGIPYGATEWVSVQAIRSFWNKYMPNIVASTTKPYRSVWGQLKFVPKNENNN